MKADFAETFQAVSRLKDSIVGFSEARPRGQDRYSIQMSLVQPDPTALFEQHPPGTIAVAKLN